MNRLSSWLVDWLLGCDPSGTAPRIGWETHVKKTTRLAEFISLVSMASLSMNVAASVLAAEKFVVANLTRLFGAALIAYAAYHFYSMAAAVKAAVDDVFLPDRIRNAGDHYKYWLSQHRKPFVARMTWHVLPFVAAGLVCLVLPQFFPPSSPPQPAGGGAGQAADVRAPFAALGSSALLQQLLVNGVVSGAVVALLSTGFSLTYSGGRFFSFTYGASAAYGAYGTYYFASRLPLPLGAALGIAAGSAVGVALEALVYRPIRGGGQHRLVLMLGSLGAYVVLQNVLSLAFGDRSVSLQSSDTQAGHAIGEARVTGIQLLNLGMSCAALALTFLLLWLTPLGRRLRAVANDAELAEVVGVAVGRTALWATGLGSALAALAGLLRGLDTDLVPGMGFDALLLAIVGCVVGGTRHFAGAVAGGALVGLLQQLSAWQLPTVWQEAVVFLALFVVLLVRPQGLVGPGGDNRAF